MRGLDWEAGSKLLTGDEARIKGGWVASSASGVPCPTVGGKEPQWTARSQKVRRGVPGLAGEATLKALQGISIRIGSKCSRYSQTPLAAARKRQKQTKDPTRKKKSKKPAETRKTPARATQPHEQQYRMRLGSVAAWGSRKLLNMNRVVIPSTKNALPIVRKTRW